MHAIEKKKYSLFTWILKRTFQDFLHDFIKNVHLCVLFVNFLKKELCSHKVPGCAPAFTLRTVA